MRRALLLVASAFLVLLPLQALAIDEALTPGTVYQTDNSTSLFYLGLDWHRYIFPNEATYLSWYDDFNAVEYLEADIINQTPIGGLVTVKPDGETWVKIQSDPKVYAVSNGGILHWIPTEDVAEAIGGSDWAARIIDLPDTVFASYTIGAPIDIFAPSLEFDAESAETISDDLALVEPETVSITNNETDRTVNVSHEQVTIYEGEVVHWSNNSTDWIPEVVLAGNGNDWGSGIIEGNGDFFARFFTKGFYHYSCRSAYDTNVPINDSCGTISVMEK
ncbi:MAG: hypothetical protein ABIG32_01940 [Candidatus Uhrbacteria bacterium]|nr:hypothetical protein [Patescibacteria group bacterium]MBU1907054.1 hypothetical protein [Patescibacteria group bacterium]